MRGKWSGDCDMGDGKLQAAKKKYEEHLGWIRCLGLKDRKGSETLAADLKTLTCQLTADLDFLTEGIKNAKASYEEKKKKKNVAEQALFALAWTVDEFERLFEMNKKLTLVVKDLVTIILKEVKGINIPKKLSVLRKDLEEYAKGLAAKNRKAASHLLVFMISDEQRSKKPYAIPVRAIPYKELTDTGLRKLRDEIREQMSALDMTTVGMLGFVLLLV